MHSSIVDGVTIVFADTYTSIGGVSYEKKIGVAYWATEKSWYVQVYKNGAMHSKHFHCELYQNAYELACEARKKLKINELRIYDEEKSFRLRVSFYNNKYQNKGKWFEYKKCGKEVAMKKAQQFIEQLNYTPYSL